MRRLLLRCVQVPDGKENAGDTGNASSPSDVVPAQPGNQNSPSVSAGADAVSNTAGVTAADAPASSTPADQVAKKEGADASKPVFKAKKRQVIDTGLILGISALSKICDGTLLMV